MKQRIALITGGSRGIGAAAVRAFAAAGWRVAFCWHSNRQAAEALAAEFPGQVLGSCWYR